MKTSETGAAATLARLEKEELSAYSKIETLKKQLDDLRTNPVTVGDDAVRIWRGRIADTESDLLAANDLWNKIAKTLLTYKKGVPNSEREGEKVPLDDVREWIAQLRLCRNIALENYIIGIAQQSPKFTAPTDFMKAHADLIRATEESAISSAVKEKQLPEWILL